MYISTNTIKSFCVLQYNEIQKFKKKEIKEKKAFQKEKGENNLEAQVINMVVLLLVAKKEGIPQRAINGNVYCKEHWSQKNKEAVHHL